MINNYTNTKKNRENPQHRVYRYGIAAGCKYSHPTRTRKTRDQKPRFYLYPCCTLDWTSV
jgi:hypothetical protein